VCPSLGDVLSKGVAVMKTTLIEIQDMRLVCVGVLGTDNMRVSGDTDNMPECVWNVSRMCLDCLDDAGQTMSVTR
jgi:hypothetical protein